MILLDTNILIVLIKRRPPQVAERIDTLAMSFITWAEPAGQRRQATIQQLEALAQRVPVLYPAGPAISRHHAEQPTALRRQGRPIGANDLWIACHALALDAVLVSHNVREFRRIEGLRLVDWATPF